MFINATDHNKYDFYVGFDLLWGKEIITFLS